MDEYIERKAFKAEVRRLSTHYLNEWDTLGVLAAVDRIPAADVRPVKRGKWINDHNGKYSSSGDNYFCSACKDPALRAFGKPARTNYCPNCGADMREA